MRIACYARVSTEEQALHGLSIEAQLAALREFAGEQSVGEYVDAGVSARIPIKKRPELQRLLRDVEAGKVDLVAFVKLDRWTRNIREYYKAQDVLDAHGVAWRALREDYETQTAAGRLKTNIMLAVAQDEADRTSERVKAVFEEKRRKGLTVNGHMPLGLDFCAGHPAPNADAEKVRELFARFVALRSLRACAAVSAEITGKRYTTTGLRQLLTNERYLTAGIISPETWERVQAILSTHATRTVTPGRVYLFSGLLVCPVCGAKMTARTYHPRGHEYVYYSCGRAAKELKCPNHVCVREDLLERYMLDHVLAAVKDHNLRITKARKKPVDVDALQRKLDRLTDLYLDEAIEKDDFDRRAAPIRDAIRAARLTPQAVDTAEIRTALETYAGLSKTAQRAFWGFLVRRIIPSGEGYEIALVLP